MVLWPGLAAPLDSRRLGDRLQWRRATAARVVWKVMRASHLLDRKTAGSLSPVYRREVIRLLADAERAALGEADDYSPWCAAVLTQPRQASFEVTVMQ